MTANDLDFTPYAGKTVLVTGAAGFIGSHLADALVDLGAQVRVVDNLVAGEMSNLDLTRSNIEFIQRSLDVDPELDDLVGDCDVVFHLAANASVPRSSEDPAFDFQHNMVATFRVLDAFRRGRGGRLVFTSSAAVYGEPDGSDLREGRPLLPRSPYAGSKLAGEYLIDAYARCYDLDQRRIRIFNTYGPRQRRFVMYDLLEKLRRDPQRLEIIGTGRQIRDYVYVGDTVRALLLVGQHPDARGGVFNVAGENPISIRDLAELIVAATGLPRPEITYTGQSWVGDVERMIGDTTRLRGLGFRPLVALEEGLARLVDWHREHFSPPW